MRHNTHAFLRAILFTDDEWASVEQCASLCMRRYDPQAGAHTNGDDLSDGSALASINAVFLVALFAPLRSARAASLRALRIERKGGAAASGGGAGGDAVAADSGAVAAYYLDVYRQLHADLRRLRRQMAARAAMVLEADDDGSATGGGSATGDSQTADSTEAADSKTAGDPTTAGDSQTADSTTTGGGADSTTARFSDAQAQRLLFEMFFPEGAPLLNASGIPDQVSALRQKREIRVTALNPQPIKHPAREILFTSNVMLTTPLDESVLAQFPRSFAQKLAAVNTESQRYWFDHPIPIGILAEENEILYGLNGLNDMMAAEKKHGTTERSARLSCLLSASSTHHGLRSLTHEYFTRYLGDIDRFEHLTVTVITEEDCEALLEQVLLPVARRLGRTEADCVALREVFGVDGEYGRHYSFLKAIAALWQVCVDSEVRATFKIDLDQIFPQKELIAQTGQSALAHFQTPLWGAMGRDYWDDPVELGMIAGSLVNEADIDRGLFTPDVVVDYATLATRQPLGQRLFSSKIPQALSTEAEMLNRALNEAVPTETDEAAPTETGEAAPTEMEAAHSQQTAQSTAAPPSDQPRVSQRVHVTGGTNGILIDALRRHRPFTPTICGRAEDQAYLISVLQRSQPYLRYLHKSGLIMRHDKEVFAGQAIKKAKTGTQVGDYVRMLFFSSYAQCHRWSAEEIKERFDPFTGAFISSMPVTIASLRSAFDAHVQYLNGEHASAAQLVRNTANRLSTAFSRLYPARLKVQVAKERRGWECYYDLLDAIEKGVAEQSDDYIDIRARAKEIIAACQITSVSD